jgi:two-component system CheB/CheR fusion protein
MKLSNSSCQYLISIIEQITELSKIQLKTFTLDLKPFDFRESLKPLIETMSIQSEFKDLEFAVKIDKNVPKKFLSDPKRINQILFSLLGNAIKYTNVGHITVCVEKILQSNDEQENFENQGQKYDQQTIQFSVEDSGKGISQEEQQNLFQLFGKVKGSSSNFQSTGVGLGLTFCKQVVEHLKGQISCQSSLNSGTKFTYFLKVGVSPSDKGLSSQEHALFLSEI